MPKPRPRLPVATLRGADPILEISGVDWDRIEKKCRRALVPEMRDELLAATWIFLALIDSEEAAQPVAASRAHLESIKKAATELRKAILEEAAKSNATRYAEHLIDQSFADPRICGKVLIVGSVMVSLVEACEKALQSLDQVHVGRKKGDTWKQWLIDLGKIAATYGWPIAARKDSDKTDRPSPFVTLVNEVQSFLPTRCRRSAGALAKSIHDARNVSGREKLVGATNKSRTKPKE